MEAIEHRHAGRRKRNSAKVNLTLSIAFHALLFGLGAFWAAREGMMGKGLQSLTVVLVPKEKKPDEPKKEEARPAETKPEPTAARPIQTARTADLPRPAAPPPLAYVENAAPPPAEIPVLTLGDLGGTEAAPDAIEAYKGYLETALRNQWLRPETPDNANLVAEVEVAVSQAGQLQQHELIRSSGDRRWDESVLKAVASTRSVGRTPPPGFPTRFLVRFDVELLPEPLL